MSTVKIREGFRVKRGFDEWDGRSQTLAVFGRERKWSWATSGASGQHIRLRKRTRALTAGPPPSSRT